MSSAGPFLSTAKSTCASARAWLVLAFRLVESLISALTQHLLLQALLERRLVLLPLLLGFAGIGQRTARLALHLVQRLHDRIHPHYTDPNSASSSASACAWSRDAVLLHLRHKGRLDNLAEALDHRGEHLLILVAHISTLGLDERHTLLDGGLCTTELLHRLGELLLRLLEALPLIVCQPPRAYGYKGSGQLSSRDDTGHSAGVQSVMSRSVNLPGGDTLLSSMTDPRSKRNAPMSSTFSPSSSWAEFMFATASSRVSRAFELRGTSICWFTFDSNSWNSNSFLSISDWSSPTRSLNLPHTGDLLSWRSPQSGGPCCT